MRYVVGVPGGKREDSETLEDCIVREIREELELDIKVLGVFCKSKYCYRPLAVFQVICKMWTMMLNAPPHCHPDRIMNDQKGNSNSRNSNSRTVPEFTRILGL